MSILREEDNLCKSRKNGWRSEVSRSSLVAQSGGKRVGREQEWGQVKNGEKEDMEPEENGSKDMSRWEQSNMSEGAADPYGMGAIAHAKPDEANAQPQTDS